HSVSASPPTFSQHSSVPAWGGDSANRFAPLPPASLWRGVKPPRGRFETMQNRTEHQDGPSTTLATHARMILALIIAATFLDVIDFSVVQVALPTISRELLAPWAEIQWVIGAYGLTMAGFLMVSGRAGDIYGKKRVFVIGIALFTIASLTAGLAVSLISLVVSRAIQGVAAAMTTATALAILAATFPEGKERNKAFGFV